MNMQTGVGDSIRIVVFNHYSRVTWSGACADSCVA